MSKSILLGSSAIVGIGLPSTYLSFHNSHETIGQVLSEDILPIDASIEESWTKLTSKLSSLEGITDSELEQIKTKKSGLKEWCSASYEKTFKRWFTETNIKLKSDVEKACVLKIRDQMENKDIYEISSEQTKKDQNKDEMTKKLSGLDSQETSLKELDGQLIKIKNSKNDQRWRRLEDWCKNSYERGYQGENSKRWKLVQKFCKKPEVQEKAK